MITLPEVLWSLTVPALKQLMALLPDAPSAGRKDEIIQTLVRGLSLSGLIALWKRLDEQERLAVGEALYAANGVFDPIQFQAKHGRLPVFETEIKRYHKAPTQLSLFLFACGSDRCVPVDLHASLKSFVPAPKPTMIATVEMPPASLNDTAMTVRLTEHEAFAELTVMLRLVEEGKMQVSDKTSMPTASTLRMLENHLVGGDFYPDEPPKKPRGDCIGPIKPFAWPMLLLGADLAQRKGTGLALTKDGQKAMANSPAEMIRSIWRRWIESTLLDEFSRVDKIKGQKAKGQVMTSVRKRRETIAWVLRLCPADKWISVEELSRYMRAAGHRFEVTHDPWALYLFDSNYGSLGYSGSHGWNILQHRYILCLLFEYVATLGMIDVAHIDPGQAPQDFSDMWGADNLEFLSRYDGLAFFRITPLGAYCLGSADKYVSASLPSQVRLSVLPTLLVKVVNGEPSMEEALTLDAWGTRETEHSWRLDRQKAIVSIERGRDIDDLLMFLRARDEQPLPDTTESFVANCRKNAKALKVMDTMLLVECQDQTTAEFIATHKLNVGLCQHVGERKLIVPLKKKEKFKLFGVAPFSRTLF